MIPSPAMLDGILGTRKIIGELEKQRREQNRRVFDPSVSTDRHFAGYIERYREWEREQIAYAIGWMVAETSQEGWIILHPIEEGQQHELLWKLENMLQDRIVERAHTSDPSPHV